MRVIDHEAAVCDFTVTPDSIIVQLQQQSPTALVSNVATTIDSLELHGQRWPLTINNAEYKNALICSPYTTYITYPLDELSKLPKLWVKAAVLLNALVMSGVCRLTKINKIVQVNNSLNSLLKHPAIFMKCLPEITCTLLLRYPKHALTFFRVNAVLDEKFLQTLKQQGYLVFPDRAVHLFFLHKSVMQRRDTKRDMALLRESPYTIVPHEAFTAEDANRVAELYHQLFVDKHSSCNPIYTALYFRRAIQYRWHTFVGLRNQHGRLDGFVSWFMSGDIMISGSLGYDQSIDAKMGLYRQLVAICLKHANDNQFIFNMGGGSDAFKLNRGSTRVLEYTAVYCKHLPFYRQIPWKIFHWIFNKTLKKIVTESSL